MKAKIGFPFRLEAGQWNIYHVWLRRKDNLKCLRHGAALNQRTAGARSCNIKFHYSVSDSGSKSEPDSESNSGCESGPASVCVARSSPRDIQNRGRQHERRIFLSNESSASPLPKVRTGYRTGWSPSLGRWEGGIVRLRLRLKN